MHGQPPLTVVGGSRGDFSCPGVGGEEWICAGPAQRGPGSALSTVLYGRAQQLVTGPD